MTSNAANPTRLTTKLTNKIHSVDIVSDTLIKIDDILHHVESMHQTWQDGSVRDKNKLGTDFNKLIAVITSIKSSLNHSLKLNGNLSLANSLMSTKRAKSNTEAKRQQFQVPEAKRKAPFEVRINQTVAEAKNNNQQPKKKQKKLSVQELKA